MNAKQWHTAVFERDNGHCAAEMHDWRCLGRAEHAHHICFRSHIPKWAYWIVANGIALSNHCHALAHATHNKNIAAQRKMDAVNAVNATIPPDVPELRVHHFEDAA